MSQTVVRPAAAERGIEPSVDPVTEPVTGPVTGPVSESTTDQAARGIAVRLNWLRAGVMGANDGIVSTAAMVVGVAGAAVSDGALLVAGVSATIAGAMSMAVGEYVSVSSQRDAVLAHEGLDLGGEAHALTNAWHAAWASMIAFAVGALVPLLAILLTPRDLAVPVTVGAVLLALAATGCVSAQLGGARHLPAVRRTVGGGLLAMAITYGIGLLVGTWI